MNHEKTLAGAIFASAMPRPSSNCCVLPLHLTTCLLEAYAHTLHPCMYISIKCSALAALSVWPAGMPLLRCSFQMAVCRCHANLGGRLRQQYVAYIHGHESTGTQHACAQRLSLSYPFLKKQACF